MKLSLFGYGNTTKAIARDNSCQIFDDNATQISKDEYGNTIYPASQFDAQNSGCEIPSPGISPSNDLIQKAKNLISEYDFFADSMPFSIWISGTNGKTTTTSMITHLLKNKGAISGGNIGVPVANLDDEANIWVLETSSFTLHYTNQASPNIYILLPITQDHISWHGSFEEYEKAKLKPLLSMQEGEVIILPNKYLDDNLYPTNGYKIGYSCSQDLADRFGIEKDKINFKEPFLFDAIISLAVQKILFDKVDYELINSFVQDPHKLEEFRDNQNRIWCDDSKATNIDATIQALQNFKTHKLFLILGGDSKGADMKPLFELLREYDVEVFIIGKDSPIISKWCDEFGIKYLKCETLENAVKSIDLKYTFQSSQASQSIALLSPACASLDQFSSYKHRGESFKKWVGLL
jgi:UDP-N-acetylmuramoylalanine--D-glutamate ligase